MQFPISILICVMVHAVPIYTATTPTSITTNGQTQTTLMSASQTAASTTTRTGSASAPTTTVAMGTTDGAMEITTGGETMSMSTTTQQTLTTTTEKTITFTKSELNALIIGSSCVLLVLVILAAVCGCLCVKTKRHRRRRHRYGAYYKHNDDDLSHSNRDILQPEVDHSAIGRDVFIPYSGEPITTHVVESGPASLPYVTTSTTRPYNPYLFDERSGQYKRAGSDRPYRSNMEVVSTRGADRNWVLSAPNLAHNLPRAWI